MYPFVPKPNIPPVTISLMRDFCLNSSLLYMLDICSSIIGFLKISKASLIATDVCVNAAGFTHTSVAIRDALDIYKKPIIELHISNIYKREEFRQKSLISDIATGGIFGLGDNGYILAIISMQNILKNENR